jgi:2-methylisocitrate lyase-like PEP mutase family enzyme
MARPSGGSSPTVMRGADCVFVPGLRDADTISQLVRDVQCPLNILAGPGSPSVLELQELGVARVSLGSAPMRATLGLLRRMAEELKTTGTYAAIEDAPSHADVNRMLGKWLCQISATSV